MKKKKKTRVNGVQERLKRGLFPVALLVLALVSGGMTARAESLPDDDSVTFRSRQLTVDEVFDAITSQLKLEVFYSENRLDASRVVQLPPSPARLADVLDVVLGNGFSYALNGRTIVISPRAQQQQRVVTTRRVSGVVTDQDNKPLPGVSVMVKGTTVVGTSTDRDGRYLLVLPVAGDVTLTFSFVGMKRQEIVCPRDRTTVDVRMVIEESEIEEVVVTGYQRIRRSEMVGSAQTVKREDLFYDGTNTIEQMLQGMLPGMLVMNTDGLVGTRQKVRVRGTSTLLGNQEPVWVVDGIIQEDPLPFKAEELNNMDPSSEDMIRSFVGSAIAWLNPNDIQDITVLKDASATVLYGVKAANGVIIITTKKGREGRLSLGYSGGVSVTDRLTYEKMNLMNSKERIAVSREMYERRLYGARGLEQVGYELELKRYLNKEISYDEFNERVKQLEELNTDWFDILYRVPVSHNHSLNLSGGTENVTYYASIYARENIGTARGNDSRSYGGSLNIDARVNDRFSVGARFSAGFSTTNSFYTVDPYSYATRSSRAIPCFDENGDRFFYKKDSQGYLYNILNELDNTGNRNEGRDASFNFNLRYDLLEGLRYETVFGYTTSTTHGETYASEESYYITKIRRYEVGAYEAGDTPYAQSQLPHGGELNFVDARTNSLTWRNSVAYNKLFADRHRLGVMIGHEARSTTRQGESSRTYGYFPNRGKNIALPPITIMSTNNTVMANSIYNNMKPTITDTKSNFLSFYGSATYSFDERYVATASVRSDASNRFGQDKRNRFLPVWSLGGRWNVHNEPWLKEQDILSELNLRATYGWQGNVLEGYGPDLILRIPDGSGSDALINPYTSDMQLKIRSLAYPDLRWEKTQTYNLGLDLGIFRNRFMISAEYYRKQTKDMLVNVMMAKAYGLESMPMNDGNMLNQGVELSVSGTVVRAKDFTWSLSLNTSKNFNRIETVLDRSAQWQAAVGGNLHKDGYPVSSFWAFHFEGLDPETGVPRFYVPTAAENLEAVTDVTAYMVRAGKLEPDFAGGLSTNFRYKTLTLSSSFNMSFGAQKFLYNMFSSTSLPNAYDNLPKEFADRWTPTNTTSNIPSIPQNVLNNAGTGYVAGDGLGASAMLPAGAYLNLYSMYNYSDERVVNASFLRCNNISLSYTLPEAQLKHLPVKNVSLTASVSNPFIIVSKDFKGMDPEVATGKQPISHTYSLNVNISF
ncbi:MAG: SusC/RagA family TonB-linked outer membrane protein [Odoribacteraceae bacterium]|jgi:TonB-linked SusC/RagA family outer membrane protein|nr:SusC/RagA family TonB-linked outer membrane protein [Odoribacteraceae bacterium]